jgi:hypothetical protein
MFEWTRFQSVTIGILERWNPLGLNNGYRQGGQDRPPGDYRADLPPPEVRNKPKAQPTAIRKVKNRKREQERGSQLPPVLDKYFIRNFLVL